MKAIACSLVALLLLSTAAPAFAGGGWGHRSWGHRHHHHRHHNGDGAVIALALIGGATIGYLLAQPARRGYYDDPPPAPSYYDCRPTTGIGYVNGRPAEFIGTWCVDQYGRAQVLPGSARFNRYLP